ncbi:MAG TPA: PIN domain-containing protein [Candidatus Hydrogenedentes bacterium]|nr:PIN domain-containing protein [Candidatus Hydrogenedentota bacterium]HIJ72671.1 PIN domain-containing protein [Candidatus Hydrogenedentota bacterium]
MRRPSIYIDTCVIGGCLDRNFETESLLLIEMAEAGAVNLMVSDLLVAELLQAPPEVRRVLIRVPERHVQRVTISAETEYLRNVYLSEGVLGKRASNDAHHVAIATVNRADMIVSWNFRHIVHYEKIRYFNSINIREGYGTIEIYSPKEVV